MEQHVLRGWRPSERPAFFAQQLVKRARELRLRSIQAVAEERLQALVVPHVSLLWRTGLAPTLSLVHEDEQQQVVGCAILPGRRRVLTVGYRAPLREWDLETGELIRSADIGTAGANSVAIYRSRSASRTSSAQYETASCIIRPYHHSMAISPAPTRRPSINITL